MPVTFAETAAAEREAFAAIGEFGRRELDAVKAWIAGGCEGPQPRPDAEERQRFADGPMAAVGAGDAASASLNSAPPENPGGLEAAFRDALQSFLLRNLSAPCTY